MKANLMRSMWAALALTMSLTLVGCASGPAASTPELLQKVESARTRADHEALTTYYVKEAESARASADLHRKMARSYQARSDSRIVQGMSSHCNRLVESFTGVAAEYDAMAAGHRQMAQQAGQ